MVSNYLDAGDTFNKTLEDRFFMLSDYIANSIIEEFKLIVNSLKDLVVVTDDGVFISIPLFMKVSLFFYFPQ